MPSRKTYSHYCAVARSLEVIGEKWSLLVVRDLLRGPLRFSDLQKYLGGITPKWLTARLRDLEAAGIVERTSGPGKREVRYQLTEKGRALAPVVESLAMWGADHAMRPRRPDETVYPEMFLQVTATYLNRRSTDPGAPVAWQFSFTDGNRPVTLRFDGSRWTATADDPTAADVTVGTTAATLLDFLNARADRPRLYDGFDIAGDADAVARFRHTFVRERAATPAASRTTA